MAVSDVWYFEAEHVVQDLFRGGSAVSDELVGTTEINVNVQALFNLSKRLYKEMVNSNTLTQFEERNVAPFHGF